MAIQQLFIVLSPEKVTVHFDETFLIIWPQQVSKLPLAYIYFHCCGIVTILIS